MPAAAGFGDFSKQLRIIAVAVHRIDGSRVNDEQGGCIVTMEEPRIGLRQFFQIGALDMLFVADAAPLSELLKLQNAPVRVSVATAAKQDKPPSNPNEKVYLREFP